MTEMVIKVCPCACSSPSCTNCHYPAHQSEQKFYLVCRGSRIKHADSIPNEFHNKQSHAQTSQRNSLKQQQQPALHREDSLNERTISWSQTQKKERNKDGKNLVRVSRKTREHVGSSRLHAQSKRRRRINDQISPQDLQPSEWLFPFLQRTTKKKKTHTN
jgi:hypothetical protein